MRIEKASTTAVIITKSTTRYATSTGNTIATILSPTPALRTGNGGAGTIAAVTIGAVTTTVATATATTKSV